MHLLNCSSLTVTNLSITVEIGTDGLLVINPKMVSVLQHVNIFVTALLSHKNFSATNGMIVLNYFQTNFSRLSIKKFTYKQQFCLITGNENIFYIVYLYNKRIEILISKFNAVVKDLCNARMLYYYYDLIDEPSKLYSYNCQVYNNKCTKKFEILN